jgi:hypothetical protein
MIDHLQDVSCTKASCCFHAPSPPFSLRTFDPVTSSLRLEWWRYRLHSLQLNSRWGSLKTFLSSGNYKHVNRPEHFWTNGNMGCEWNRTALFSGGCRSVLAKKCSPPPPLPLPFPTGGESLQREFGSVEHQWRSTFWNSVRFAVH